MTQLSWSMMQFVKRCELLSNLYLCIGWHSRQAAMSNIGLVVNCFQICIFVSDDTAPDWRCGHSTKLWIAFKFVSLYRMTQPNLAQNKCLGGCELLSNLYLCIGWHSKTWFRHTKWSVVNCFQICIFVSDDTALYNLSQSMRKLWIAFKFVSLYRMTQLFICKQAIDYCCELLSNLYLCIGWHSEIIIQDNVLTVVNCFQICIFVSDDTAKRSY